MPNLNPFGIFCSLKNMDDLGTLRLVVFRVGSLICSVPAAAVREVIPALPATRIPGAGETVAGLINVRGTLLTVIDARLALGDGARGRLPESVLVLDRGTRSVGLAVDEVLDLVELPRQSLATGGELPGVDPRYVKAVGRLDQRVFTVLDTDALVAPVVE